jgi:Laminin B (Domain IV)
VAVDLRNLELVFEDTKQLTPDRKYFWKLPVQFIGNKLGSYGGHLSFALSQERRRNDPDKRFQVSASKLVFP